MTATAGTEQQQPRPQHRRRRRKLRVLVVTLGGERQETIQRMFEDDPFLSQDFEPPVFSLGVQSRQLRSRWSFLQIAAQVGLLPDVEWTALQQAQEEYETQTSTNTTTSASSKSPPPPPPNHDLFDCLKDVPIMNRENDGRMGSDADLKVHYCVELWRKAKSLNRGRAVLACIFAHLLAMKTFVESNNNSNNDDDDGDNNGFDLILEDNVRVSPKHCADRIWESIDACREWEATTIGKSQRAGESDAEKNSTDDNDNDDHNDGRYQRRCHLRLVGWLGSVTNLHWMFDKHIPKRQFKRSESNSSNDRSNDHVIPNDDDDDPSMEHRASIFPFPRPEFLQEDLKEMFGDDDDNGDDTVPSQGDTKTHARPGGNPIWGNYGYWISADGYHKLMDTLRKDVGAMLWKGKRMKVYLVKPIDKIVPRQMMSLMGPESVQLSTHPAFFRAPMLTSKIHTQWDPEFCKSTQVQLDASGMDWSDLWLTETEQRVVDHHSQTGVWLTPAQLDQLE